jgi:hypothetical protein
VRVVLVFVSSIVVSALSRRRLFRMARIVAPALFVFAILAASVGPPASADEKTSLANVLLIEQMIDVATTQQLLHSESCGPPMPVVDATKVRVGVLRRCITGTEADPLARPFVVSPLLNAGAAIGINGLLRLALHRVSPRRMRWLRLGVVLYPTVIVGTVSSSFDIARFGPSVTLSKRHH